MQQPELEFPLHWEYKIIALHSDSVQASLEAVSASHGCTTPVLRGNQSSSGKYATYTVRIHVQSREHLDALRAEFSQCPGVRYLL
ncbi:MAG: DUF493 domain-containing protein [Desulfovibrionales bacterium]|nr:DUF493 domain-containing protein [Desulfovibrionales bacterium]